MHLRILSKVYKIFDFICTNNNILQSLYDYSLLLFPTTLHSIISRILRLVLVLVRVKMFKKVEHRRDTPMLKGCVFWLIVIRS